jgi:hypothetical protein
MRKPQRDQQSSRRAVVLGTTAGLAALGAAVYVGLDLTIATTARAAEVKLFKNPECQCCEGYAQYLRDNGYSVVVEATQDLAPMQRMAGVPEGFEGCHLSMIDGYSVAGHVPVAIVNRLLQERPRIRGIVLPGMPMGSPGMNGSKEEPFVVYEIGGVDAGGGPKVYATE